MNNNRLACYYSIVRFCPYPETDEFVNVGVILACPSIGYQGFLRARRRLARVNDFFPELDSAIYSTALGSLDALLQKRTSGNADHQLLIASDSKRFRDDFFDLIRPRESILYFSEARVIMSADPASALKELFDAYVERRFAHQSEYQEQEMCRRLEAVLKQHQLMDDFQRNRAVGNELFHVTFPFVHFDQLETVALRAIKALHFDKKDPSDIFHHAGRWQNSIKRLKLTGTAPKDLLFVLHPPGPNKPRHMEAFDQIRRDFDAEKLVFTTEEKTEDLLRFAQLK